MIAQKYRYLNAQAAMGYQGDPGLFSFVGKALRKVAGVVTGGVSEQIISAGGQLLKRKKGRASTMIPMLSGMAISRFDGTMPVRPGIGPQATDSIGGSMTIGPFSGTYGHKRTGNLTQSGGPDFGDVTGGGSTTAMGGPRGYHLNKKGYYTSQGFVPAHSRWVRNRSRNPLNHRALSKAISRVAGFTHLEKRVTKALAPIARHHHRATRTRAT